MRLAPAVVFPLLLIHVHAVQDGLSVANEDMMPSGVVALWGKADTAASAVRCTGVFIAPEAVLTAATCLLAGMPSSLLQHAACAHGATGCPMLPGHAFQALDALQLPSVQEVVADVIDYEFRYSDPSTMAQVCTGGAVCGDGWDIAVLRVRQLCPRQRCVPPLPLSLGTLQMGDPLRLMGVGAAAPSAPSPRPLDDAGYALRYHDGAVASVHANQSLTLTASASAAALGQAGPVACVGDAGAPVLR